MIDKGRGSDGSLSALNCGYMSNDPPQPGIVIETYKPPEGKLAEALTLLQQAVGQTPAPPGRTRNSGIWLRIIVGAKPPYYGPPPIET
jgi:hypothetical protein